MVIRDLPYMVRGERKMGYSPSRSECAEQGGYVFSAAANPVRVEWEGSSVWDCQTAPCLSFGRVVETMLVNASFILLGGAKGMLFRLCSPPIMKHHFGRGMWWRDAGHVAPPSSPQKKTPTMKGGRSVEAFGCEARRAIVNSLSVPRYASNTAHVVVLEVSLLTSY